MVGAPRVQAHRSCEQGALSLRQLDLHRDRADDQVRDLLLRFEHVFELAVEAVRPQFPALDGIGKGDVDVHPGAGNPDVRSEEHTSELQSLMRISYAVFCLKKKKIRTKMQSTHTTLNNMKN